MIADRTMPTVAALDTTDIPRADPALLALMLELLVDSGHGLIMLNDTDVAAVQSVELAFWRHFDGDTAEGVATIVRFRALIAVFASRRLASLLMREGFPVLQAAFRVAADLRLNPSRGFSPQGIVWAVTAALNSSRSRPRAQQGATAQFAA